MFSIVTVFFLGMGADCVRWDGATIDKYLFIESMTVEAKDEITIKLRPRFQAAASVSSDRMIISVLVPKIWKMAKNGVLTYEITSDAPGEILPMYLIPTETSPKQNQWQGMTWAEAMKARFGFGQNLADSEMEWVSYWSDAYEVVGNKFNKSVIVYIKIKTSDDNVKFKFGFFLNHSDDGISTNPEHWKIITMDKPFQTYGALGGVINFCEAQPNAAIPMFVTKDDIVTIKYFSEVKIVDLKGDTVKTALCGASEVFLCASAYTSSGKYDVGKTKMMRESEFNFSFTFWPADYFGIPEDEKISRIDYYFVNADQSLHVKELDIKTGNEVPFIYLFDCR